jgi:hypothetical protein
VKNSGGAIGIVYMRKVLAIEVSSSELHEITDFLVILSVAVFNLPRNGVDRRR